MPAASNTSLMEAIQDTLLQGKLPPTRYPLRIGLRPAELCLCFHAWIQSTTNWLNILVIDLLSWAHLAFAPQGKAALSLLFLLTTPPSLLYRKACCQLTDCKPPNQRPSLSCTFSGQWKSYLQSLEGSCNPPNFTQAILQHWAHLGWAAGVGWLCPEVYPPLRDAHMTFPSPKNRGVWALPYSNFALSLGHDWEIFLCPTASMQQEIWWISWCRWKHRSLELSCPNRP